MPTCEAAEGLMQAGPFRTQRGPHRIETLDLVVPDKDDYRYLCETLEKLLSIFQEEKKCIEHESFFWQTQWLDLGKKLTDTISASEWSVLCERANLPFKKTLINSYFKGFAEEKDIEEKGLTIEHAAELLAELKEKMEESYLPPTSTDEEEENYDPHPLYVLWDSLMESDPVPPVKYENSSDDLELQVNVEEESISTIAFLSFIRSEQKQFSTSLEETQTLVRTLNSLKTLCKDKNDSQRHGDDRLSKSRFLSYLASDANDIIDSSERDDMDYPLTHYWIKTSHDSYLAKLPNSFRSFKDGLDYKNYGMVEYQGFLQALHRGARCLELDVYDGLFDSPVVARTKPTTASDNHCIPFVQVLQSIRSFLYEYPDSFPIILCLETHCSESNQAKMAEGIVEVFEDEGLLYRPPEEVLSNSSFKPMPSPEDLQGKVIIKNKRPRKIRKGGTVMNDDFDEDNDLVMEQDEEEDYMNMNEEDEDAIEEELGFVVGFNADGAIRSKEDMSAKQTPSELYAIAQEEAAKCRTELRQAKEKEQKLNVELELAEIVAHSSIEKSDSTAEQIIEKVQQQQQKPKNVDDNGNIIGRVSTSFDTSDLSEPEMDEGLEVQDFFGNSVEDARVDHSEADAGAKSASRLVSQALDRLTEAKRSVEDAKSSVEESYRLEKLKKYQAEKAANEARQNRQHADAARGRVETVKRLLRSSKDSAASAETVVVTAMTEAKISEQRASETEGRAARALATAEKERARADRETKKEEVLETEAASLHDKCVEASQEAKTTRSRMEKCMSMLDRVNEQIKLIERSSQFQKELKEHKQGNNSEIPLNSSPVRGSNFLVKHAGKIQERDACTRLIKEAAVANQTAELRRKRAAASFEDKAHRWKMQSEVAAQARKQADRSSHHAEELAELAEEEREAASLRHIAREKAQMSVNSKDNYQTSVQAQLVEASRASEEAASVALESRIKAEKLEREAELAKDHSKVLQHVENMEKVKEEAEASHQEALEKQKEAATKAENAKRLLDTSAEVYTNAQRDAAQEQDSYSTRRERELTAIQAYKKYLSIKKEAAKASLQAEEADQKLVEKENAEKRAHEYKFKMDRRGPLVPELAQLTLYHSTRFKTWEQSHKMPNSHMHSICEPRVYDMLDNDEDDQRERFIELTKDHFCRTFPSWRTITEHQEANYDPVIMHSLGCQLVSMNFNSSDEKLILNDGRFRANGSCGYVLKPPHLRGESLMDRPAQWRFKILSGSYLPKGEKSMLKKSPAVGLGSTSVSPFVRVAVHEGTLHAETIIHETKTVSRNGFAPIWGNEEDEFDVKVKQPSIALLSFTVWDDETHDFVAGAALPMTCLRQGYRSISLFDSMHSRIGPYASASIVLKVQKLS